MASHLRAGPAHGGGEEVDAQAVQPEQLRALQRVQRDSQRKGCDAQHILGALRIQLRDQRRRAVAQRVGLRGLIRQRTTHPLYRRPSCFLRGYELLAGHH